MRKWGSAFYRSVEFDVFYQPAVTCDELSLQKSAPPTLFFWVVHLLLDAGDSIATKMQTSFYIVYNPISFVLQVGMVNPIL